MPTGTCLSYIGTRLPSVSDSQSSLKISPLLVGCNADTYTSEPRIMHHSVAGPRYHCADSCRPAPRGRFNAQKIRMHLDDLPF